MSKNGVICPKCLSAGEVVISAGRNNGKRVLNTYECNLCHGKGYVSKEIEEDFIISMNEDLLTDDYE